MNILFVSREFPPSKRCAGIGTYVKQTSEMLSRQGHNVFVISASDNIFQNVNTTTNKVTIYRIKGGDFYISQNFFGKVYSKVRSISHYNSYRRKVKNKIEEVVRCHNIDIVELPDYGNEGKFWLNNKKTTTVIRVHGPLGFCRDSLKFKFHKRRVKSELFDILKADGISFVSESLRYLISREKKIKSDLLKFEGKISVIPNSIHLDKNNNLEKKHSTDKLYILGAGTINKEKGWSELINACSKLSQEGIQLHLKIFGRFSSFGKILNNKIRKDKRLKSIIQLPGPTSWERLYKEYKAADICCFPSWYEPFGLTIIEAMSASSIVIASLAGGGSEIIEHEVNGFLVKPKSTKEIVSTIKHIIELSDKERLKIRLNARKTIEENFSNDVISKKVELFYQHVISSTNGY